MHFDWNSLVSLGVSANLLLSIARHFFSAPRQQAQIDSMEGKLDGVLNVVQTFIPPAALGMPAALGAMGASGAIGATGAIGAKEKN